MAWLSKLNPTPSFPPYTGPYDVGSVDVEIPATQITSPSLTPENAPATVAFRIFYPCRKPTSPTRPVRWIPNPQRGFVSAFARFLGANSLFANAISHFPQLIYHVTIPVHRNADILPAPNSSKRWPMMVFSHGLAGSRNTYSHICGSVASHGVVVVAVDHRDGSAPVSYIRATENTKATTVEYIQMEHNDTPEVFSCRNKQLKIRLWELGLAHEALLKIDQGSEGIHNLDSNSFHHRKHDSNDVLSRFENQLDVHRPGAICWAGHSFGGSTTVQFVKSTFWRPSEKAEGYEPLFEPDPDSALVKQITLSSPVVLLDVWCLPLMSPSTKWLFDKPLPCYAPSGPGGTNLLCILSDAFFKWRAHLEKVKHLLSEDPSVDSPKQTKPGPHFFYPSHSAHLSQSDFGILFPWITKKALKAEEPERVLRLNTRAICQILRNTGLEVADTSEIDREEQEVEKTMSKDERGQDWKILAKDGGVRGWITLDTRLDLEDEGKDGKLTKEISKDPADIVGEGEAIGDVRA
ncbi:hypothetical protein M501DRAFT_1016478 [Patellaria atrata CBS 101060]|uniref:Putative phospholipase n=1 Tax=Patellaria atrata CBS 101060 TaxID=1346257 RepID=A0A9P4VN64_9PEZI|nr:hypothetical protein M501DRAFT_1016478 [Patellaria atrata CBS 101060]